MVKSAARTIGALEVLADVPEGLSHAELAERLAIPRSSLTGLLENLMARDFVEWDEARRRYLTGFAVLRLGRSYLDRLDLVHCARPLIARLSEEIGEACALTVWREHAVVVIAKMDDPDRHRPSLSLQLVHSGPLDASASGKAMLAAGGRASVEGYLASLGSVPVDPQRKLDADTLRQDLETALTTGFGWSRGEMFDDIMAVGVAIRGSGGAVVAGLSVSLPRERCTEGASRRDPDCTEGVSRGAFGADGGGGMSGTGLTIVEKTLSRVFGETVRAGALVFPEAALVTMHDWYAANAGAALDEFGIE